MSSPELYAGKPGPLPVEGDAETKIQGPPADASPGAADAPGARPADDASAAVSVLYVPGTALPKLGRYVNQVVEVRIAGKYLSTKNKEVHTRQIWGTDVYTDDSDVVAVCQHTGKIMLRPSPPVKLIGLSVFLKVPLPMFVRMSTLLLNDVHL